MRTTVNVLVLPVVCVTLAVFSAIIAFVVVLASTCLSQWRMRKGSWFWRNV